MGAGSRSNTLVVPQAIGALDQLKYEVAQELGIAIPQDGYYGNMVTRDTGSIGAKSRNVWFRSPNSNLQVKLDKPK